MTLSETVLHEKSARAPALVAVTSTSGRHRRVPRPVRRASGVVLAIGIWQLLSGVGVIDTAVLDSPLHVATTGWQLIRNGELPSALGVSLQRVAKGLLLGGLAGIVLAIIAGLWRFGEDLLDAPLQMLRTVPFAGLIPLLIVWFGVGEKPKVALIALGVAFPLYINLFAGIRGVDPALVEASRTLGLSRFALIRHVILPGALPSLLVGLRFSLGISWLALVFAEQVNATNGLGYLMTNAQELFQTNVIVVCLAVYALLGLGVDLLVRTLERVLLSWRPRFQGA